MRAHYVPDAVLKDISLRMLGLARNRKPDPDKLK